MYMYLYVYIDIYVDLHIHIEGLTRYPAVSHPISYIPPYHTVSHHITPYKHGKSPQIHSRRGGGL